MRTQRASGQPISDFEPADALELIGGGGAYSMNPGALLVLSIRCPLSQKIINAILHGAG
jgi:hypothetical protein